MIDMFGEGYTRLEYKKMVKKYTDMTKTYVIQTNLHKEALLTYVRFKVKEEMATSRGDVQEAQKWYQAAQDAAEKAKITPKQLTNFKKLFGKNKMFMLSDNDGNYKYTHLTGIFQAMDK